MKLKIIKRGTHLVKLSKANNDIPSPPSVVADYLAELEYYLKDMVRLGGSNYALKGATNHLRGLNEALEDATKQGWELHLEVTDNV